MKAFAHGLWRQAGSRSMNAGQIVLVAVNVGDLDAKLQCWGATAPPRLERRGRQKELEAWSLNRLLSAEEFRRGLEYPLEVREGERPDFLIKSGDRLFGIEVTELVDENEQELETLHAKMDRNRESAELAPKLRLVSSRGCGLEIYFKIRLSAQVGRKSKAASGYENPVEILLIYLNTNSSLIQSPPGLHRFLLGGLCWDKSVFEEVWLLSGDFVTRAASS
jgi:hypothetical protein